eukprot:UN15851
MGSICSFSCTDTKATVGTCGFSSNVISNLIAIKYVKKSSVNHLPVGNVYAIQIKRRQN